MRYLLSATVWFVLASTSNVLAQSKADEEAVSKLPQEFCDAWAKHDGHALAKIMAEDVDFVTVATTYLHGRADFETVHVRLLGGRFKDSTITLLKTTTRFLRPDMAVIHWSWKIEGDKNPDGTPRQPRYGMMTLGGCRTEVRSEVQGVGFIGKHSEIVGEWLGELSSASDSPTVLLWSATGDHGLGTFNCSKAAFSNLTGTASTDCAWHKSVSTRCAHFLTRES
jgi:uncharacterized protein (TIGR02246 family)